MLTRKFILVISSARARPNSQCIKEKKYLFWQRQQQQQRIFTVQPATQHAYWNRWKDVSHIRLHYVGIICAHVNKMHAYASMLMIKSGCERVWEGGQAHGSVGVMVVLKRKELASAYLNSRMRPRFSFFWNSQNNFFLSAAKFFGIFLISRVNFVHCTSDHVLQVNPSKLNWASTICICVWQRKQQQGKFLKFFFSSYFGY